MRQLVITFEIILYMTLQSAMGLNFSGVLRYACLGIRAMKVTLIEGGSQCMTHDSLTTFQTSTLIKSQK